MIKIMKIVVDANIYLAIILNEPEKNKIIEATRDCDLISPVILPEIAELLGLELMEL